MREIATHTKKFTYVPLNAAYLQEELQKLRDAGRKPTLAQISALVSAAGCKLSAASLSKWFGTNPPPRVRDITAQAVAQALGLDADRLTSYALSASRTELKLYDTNGAASSRPYISPTLLKCPATAAFVVCARSETDTFKSGTICFFKECEALNGNGSYIVEIGREYSVRYIDCTALDNYIRVGANASAPAITLARDEASSVVRGQVVAVLTQQV